VATFISNSPDETESFGRQFAGDVKPGDVLALIGGLGSGKTRFVKGLTAGLDATTPATSPTFTLIHEYSGGRLPVYHFDFYRIKNEREAIDIGCEEYFDSGHYCFVEWPEKIINLLPKEIVRITIEVPAIQDETRLITFQYE